jgi:hypothetical protein
MKFYMQKSSDHLSPASAEVKNAWIYMSTPTYVFMAWYLVKHRDKFTYLFTLENVRSPAKVHISQSNSGCGLEE